MGRNEFMSYTRWYDEDNYTRLLMNTLEQMEDEIKLELADDLIQLIIQNQYSSDIDVFLKEINNQYLPSRRRWYDQNETVHSAVKMIKCISRNISGDDKKNILSEFFYSIISCKGDKGLVAIEAKS